jgi:hypothetical protein
LIDTSAIGLFSGTIQQAALNPAVAVTDRLRHASPDEIGWLMSTGPLVVIVGAPGVLTKKNTLPSLLNLFTNQNYTCLFYFAFLPMFLQKRHSLSSKLACKTRARDGQQQLPCPVANRWHLVAATSIGPWFRSSVTKKGSKLYIERPVKGLSEIPWTHSSNYNKTDGNGCKNEHIGRQQWTYCTKRHEGTAIENHKARHWKRLAAHNDGNYNWGSVVALELCIKHNILSRKNAEAAPFQYRI